MLSDSNKSEFKIYAEGTGLGEVLRIPGVNFRKTFTNNIHEICNMLGVEAARNSIIAQTKYTISIYGIVVDYRHISLLSDVITYNGFLMGLNRYGIVKMKNSPLMLASFEKTGDILFDAAFFGSRDRMRGVSEKIMIGSHANIGTSKFSVYTE